MQAIEVIAVVRPDWNRFTLWACVAAVLSFTCSIFAPITYAFIPEDLSYTVAFLGSLFANAVFLCCTFTVTKQKTKAS
jgi:hypothetical protein